QFTGVGDDFIPNITGGFSAILDRAVLKGITAIRGAQDGPTPGRMALTSLRVSSYDFSGQISPSKPSGMPMTLHLYFRNAHLTAARMTALRPGASPPPVHIPIHRISVIAR